MRRPRRTKKRYADLFDDPTTLFKSAKVILYPNGEPEIWIQSLDGRRSIKITGGDGPAGLGIHIDRHAMGDPFTISGNLAPDYEVFPPKGEGSLDLATVSIVQYRGDDWSHAFKAWCNGLGPYPGERPD